MLHICQKKKFVGHVKLTDQILTGEEKPKPRQGKEQPGASELPRGEDCRPTARVSREKR